MNRLATAIGFGSAWLLIAPICGAQSTPGAQPPAAPAEVRSTSETSLDDLIGSERWDSGRYRLTPTDVIELTFPYVPELNQILTVQPDGYVTVRPTGELRVQGRTVPEVRQMLFEAYAPILREPAITIVLREFQKPYFVASGEVKQPGRFDLRGSVTVTQALALAGGTTDAAKHSQVILFRRYSADLVEVKEIDVKKMFASKDLSEDHLLRPGDTLFVPRSVLSRLKPFLPTAGLGVYLNPFR